MPSFAATRKTAATLNAVGQVGGAIQGVAAQGPIVYVTVGPRLVSMRVSEAGLLTEIGGTQALPRFLRDVMVGGTFAYVAAGEAGIYVIDVSDPTTPTVVGSWDSPGYAEAVAVVGTTLYLADGHYGLRVVDVSDPVRPVEIAWAFPLYYALDVAVAGNLAAIASVTAGLLMADVSDPRDPVERGFLDTDGGAFGVDTDGQTVYLADGWGGVVAADISRPGNPRILASSQTPGWAMDVAVENGIALVANGLEGMRVVDVSVPTSPKELSALEFKGHALKLTTAGDRAYLLDRSTKLRVLDVSDASNPALLSVFSSAGQVEDVSVSGTHAYLASGSGGVHVIDVSDPSAPRHLAQHDTLGYANSVSVVKDTAFVTTMHGQEDLEILDVSDPARPVSLGFGPQPRGPHRDLDMSGSIAFIADEGGLAAVDVSDPARAFEAGWIDLQGLASHSATAGVGVQGTLAAVAQERDGTVFVDVSDPSNMTVLSRFQKGGDWAWDATLQGDLAYVADGGIRVLDITDPKDPIEVGFAPSPTGDAREITVDGTVAYLTTAKTGVLAFDVSDPTNPVQIGEYDSLGLANRADAQDGLLYVADGEGGVLILETLSPEAREVLASRAARQSACQAGRSDEFTAWPRTSASRLADQALSRRSSIRPQLREGPDHAARVASTDSPAAATTYQVTTTADSGTGSLRWCMEQAQSGDTIIFDSTVFPPRDPATIMLSSELPTITQGALTIDASDSGVILDGLGLPVGGIVLSSDGNTIRGLQIYDCDVGIQVFGNGNVIGGDRSLGVGPVGQGNVLSANSWGVSIWQGGYNIITGNLVGTDVTGRQARGNQNTGIDVLGHDNVVGGYEPGERNIVSANGYAGISLHLGASVGNRVIGNYVGTDIDGTTALGNHRYGVGAEQGGASNLIEGNLVSGNDGHGVLFGDPGSAYNTVVGNIVGLDASGTKALGNALSGIFLGQTSPGFNRVGGTSPGDRNIVSGNHGEGITVAGDNHFVVGNYIGTDVTGTQAVGNGGGVVIGLAAHSFVGGARGDERNVISGNGSGVVVSLSFDNVVMGNYIGVDPGGAVAMPNQGAAHFDSASGHNVFQRNVISGNGSGVSIGDGSERNLLRSNRIGVSAGDASAIPDQWLGVRIESASNQIGGPYPEDGNIIAHNEGGGVQVWTYPGNSILGNSIHGNNGPGIGLENGANGSLPAPEVALVTLSTVRGQTCEGCVVEIFSDEDGQGRVFEGSTRANAAGSFEYLGVRRLQGPNITCTATDAVGNTSPFSEPSSLPFPRTPRRRIRSATGSPGSAPSGWHRDR